MPNADGTTTDGRYRFVINDYDTEADFVVVSGKGLRQEHVFHVSPKNTILLTGEPYGILDYPKGYCRQFGVVCSCQPEIKGENVVYTPPYCLGM